MSGVYEMSDEERRIAMLAIAGFELGNEERKAIRPLYLRLFVDAGGKLKDGVEVRPPWAPSNIALQNVLEQVAAERRRQDKQWGGASHDDDHGPSEWLGFLKEHRDRAAKTVKDSEAYRHRLVVIAALAVAAIEAHDRSGKR